MRSLLLYIILFAASFTYAQSIGIGTTTPDSSAILDISSTTKGLLLPRMTTAQRDAIVNPVNGLMIYNIETDCNDTYANFSWLSHCGSKVTESKSNVWIQKTSFPGTMRKDGITFYLNNRVYFGLGQNISSIYLNDLWEFDPSSNTWTQKANLSVARSMSSAFSIGDKGYVVGGKINASTNTNQVWQYNAATNLWSQKSNYIGPSADVSNLTSFALDGYGYAGKASQSGSFYKYDPNADSWIFNSIYPSSVIRNKALSIELKNSTSQEFAFVGGGFTADDTYLSSIYKYNPANSQWTIIPTILDTANINSNPSFPVVEYSAVGIKDTVFLLRSDGSTTIKTFLYRFKLDANNNLTFVNEVSIPGVYPAINSKTFRAGEHLLFGLFSNNEIWEYIYTKGLYFDYNLSPQNVYNYQDLLWEYRNNKTSLKHNSDFTISGKTTLNNKTIISPQSSIIDPDTLTNKIGFGRIADGGIWDVPLGIGGKNGNTWGIGSGGGSLYIGLGNTAPNSLQTAIEFNQNRNIFLSPNNAGNIGIGTNNPRGHLHFSNLLINRKVVLYQDDGLNNDHQFLGMGINAFTFRFQVSNPADSYKFYTGTSATTSNLLFTIGGNNGVTTEGNTLVKGNTTQEGAFNFKRHLVSINTSNTFVDVSGKSYILIQCTDPNTPIIYLGNGAVNGQILILESAIQQPYILDNTQSNLTLSGNFTMNGSDTIMLIWSGTRWVEISRSNNP
ncbi:MAG: hypothetical protein RLZZ546_2205 [Bacteroidota bacterium]|jgi:hypothetical protein